MSQAIATAAAEAATRKVEAHRARALEILGRPAFSDGFRFIDRGAVLRDLAEARAEIGAALAVLGSIKSAKEEAA